MLEQLTHKGEKERGPGVWVIVAWMGINLKVRWNGG